MTSQLQHKGQIVVIDDQEDELLQQILREEGYGVRTAANGPMGISTVQDAPPDLILLDINMPQMNGFEVGERLKRDEATRDIPIIYISALDSASDKERAFNVGGQDYVEKPFNPREVLIRIHTHISLRRLQAELESRVSRRTAELLEAQQQIEELNCKLTLENQYLQEDIQGSRALDALIGESPAIDHMRAQIKQVAPTQATALILGESGTGKELVAGAIHALSPRQDRAMIKVNCASIPKELFESEFFGHVRGSFTGAIKDREGRFAAADGGTLFLDEVGEIPLLLQGKLLRVLQEGQYERVGEEKTRKVDVRLVAATNRNLKVEVAAGRFREDLYFRLNVYPIEIPPLRERDEDIPLLIEHFSASCSRRLGLPAPDFSPADLHCARAYDWPGNVRECINIIERSIITGSVLPLASLSRNEAESPRPVAERIYTDQEIQEIEKDNILRVLKAAGGKVSGPGGAAERLGLRPTTLASRIKKYGLNP